MHKQNSFKTVLSGIDFRKEIITLLWTQTHGSKTKAHTLWVLRFKADRAAYQRSVLVYPCKAASLLIEHTTFVICAEVNYTILTLMSRP